MDCELGQIRVWNSNHLKGFRTWEEQGKKYFIIISIAPAQLVDFCNIKIKFLISKDSSEASTSWNESYIYLNSSLA